MIFTVAKRSTSKAVDLYYKIIEKCTPSASPASWIIIIPGGPGGDHKLALEYAKDLSHFAHIVLFDPRGCGNSGFNHVDECTLSQAVEDLEALRIHLNISKPILLGGSYGSLVALSYALKYPKQLSHLILNSGLYNGSKITKEAKKQLKLVANSRQTKLGLKLLDGKLSGPKDVLDYYHYMMPLYIDGDNRNPVTTVPSKATPQALEKSARTVQILNKWFSTWSLSVDLSKQLGHISTPTLILAGACDFIVAAQNSIEMHHLIKGSQLKIFPHAGHMIWKNNHNEFVSSIGLWLKEH